MFSLRFLLRLDKTIPSSSSSLLSLDWLLRTSPLPVPSFPTLGLNYILLAQGSNYNTDIPERLVFIYSKMTHNNGGLAMYGNLPYGGINDRYRHENL